MGNKKEKTTVKWWDAVSYYNREEMPGKLFPEVTVGEIVREEKEYIIITENSIYLVSAEIDTKRIS